MNAVKKRFTSGSSNVGSPPKEDLRSVSTNLDDLSPELVPIVTLLSSQSHRRYYEGIFMLYYDLNGDGKPADREWKEVYGILTGNQLAYWDAANLASFKNSNNPHALLENASKPNYINFTDSVFNAMKVLPAAKQNLENVIIVSTTLKNRYIIQFKAVSDLNNWYSALRLSNFEYQLLQHAYTGALLSARGSRLSDIKTILAEKRFDHEDWVSIRYGSGMAWKRCYAVIEPSTSKRKSFIPGRILFYENDQKKKKQLMAVVTNSSSVCAVYPQSHQLIDHSTMLKLEGYINFKSPSVSTKVSKKSIDDFKNTSIFLMPEQHSSVPGFDTLIRFLIPLLDSFGLYGRPKRLKAERLDPDSLLFGLPTLPHVHYLELTDLAGFSNKSDFLTWDVKTWNDNLKSILKTKLNQGYEGCGSARGFAGALNTLNSPLSPNDDFSPKNSPKPQFASLQKTKLPLPPTGVPPANQIRDVSNGSVVYNPKNVNHLTVQPPVDPRKSMELGEIYQKYLDIKSPSDRFNSDRNRILNGSAESFNEDVLPEGIRKINLDENIYPADDRELFSEEDEDETDGLSLTGSDKFDSREIGLLLNKNLVVPSYNNRNSSYSSVQSPTTQYNEFNEKFQASITPKKQAPFPTRDIHHSSSVSDEESDDSPPPVPAHNLNSSPYKPNRIHKPNYITSPNSSQNHLPSDHDELRGLQTSGPNSSQQSNDNRPVIQRPVPHQEPIKVLVAQPHQAPRGYPQSKPMPPPNNYDQQQFRAQNVAPLNQNPYNNTNAYQMGMNQRQNPQQYGRPVAQQATPTRNPQGPHPDMNGTRMGPQYGQNYATPFKHQPQYQQHPQQSLQQALQSGQQIPQQVPQNYQARQPQGNIRNYGGQFQYQYHVPNPKQQQPQQQPQQQQQQQQKPNPYTRQY